MDPVCCPRLYKSCAFLRRVSLTVSLLPKFHGKLIIKSSGFSRYCCAYLRMVHKFLAKFMELYCSWWTAGIRSAFGCAHRVPRLKPSQKSLSGSKLPSNPFPLDFACCSSRIVGRGFDLRKEFTSVNSSSGPELTRKRLVRELRRSFVFEKNHPAKDEDFSRTLNICIVLSFFCGSRVIR